ncbi:MAG: nuclease A inhibitor family protein [Nodosilinea sp.]
MIPKPHHDRLETYVHQLQDLVADLWYPSETDAPLEVLVWVLPELDRAGLSQQLGVSPAAVKEQSADRFFSPILANPVYRTAQGKNLAQGYRRLQDLINRNLANLHSYRVGKVEVELYLVGRHPSGQYVALHTSLVET